MAEIGETVPLEPGDIGYTAPMTSEDQARMRHQNYGGGITAQDTFGSLMNANVQPAPQPEPTPRPKVQPTIGSYSGPMPEQSFEDYVAGKQQAEQAFIQREQEQQRQATLDSPTATFAEKLSAKYGPAWEAGARSSVPGLTMSAGPSQYQPQGMDERAVSMASNLIFNAPTLVLGDMLAGPAGALGMTQGTTEVLQRQIEKGKIKTLSDLNDALQGALKATGKGYVTGAALGAAGKIPVTGVKSGLGKLAAEYTALAATEPVLFEGRAPTKEEMADAAVMLGGMSVMRAARRGGAKPIEEKVIPEDVINLKRRTWFRRKGYERSRPVEDVKAEPTAEQPTPPPDMKVGDTVPMTAADIARSQFSPQQPGTPAGQPLRMGQQGPQPPAAPPAPQPPTTPQQPTPPMAVGDTVPMSAEDQRQAEIAQLAQQQEADLAAEEAGRMAADEELSRWESDMGGVPEDMTASDLSQLEGLQGYSIEDVPQEPRPTRKLRDIVEERKRLAQERETATGSKATPASSFAKNTPPRGFRARTLNPDAKVMVVPEGDGWHVTTFHNPGGKAPDGGDILYSEHHDSWESAVEAAASEGADFNQPVTFDKAPPQQPQEQETPASTNRENEKLPATPTEIPPDVRLSKKGTPYASEMSARAAAKRAKAGDVEVVPVEGGYGYRVTQPTEDVGSQRATTLSNLAERAAEVQRTEPGATRSNASLPAPGSELTTFARDVQRAANSVGKEGRFGDKAFIHRAYAEYNRQHPDAQIPYYDFQEKLIAANRAGLIQMARADLVQAMNPEDVKASNTVQEIGGVKSAEFNFIRTTGEGAQRHSSSVDVAPLSSELERERLDWLSQPPKTRAGQRLVRNIQRDTEGKKYGPGAINDLVLEALNVVVRYGNEQTTAGKPANYQPLAHMIRSRSRGWQINLHEAGHAMSQLIRDKHPDFLGGFSDALVALTQRIGTMSSLESAEEGFAEWTRLYVFNPSQLDPALRSGVEAFLQKNYPQYLDAIQDAAKAYAAHRSRSIEAQYRSMMREKPPRKPVKVRAHDVWTSFLVRFLSHEAAVDERIYRPIVKSLDRFSKGLAKNFLKELERGPADVRHAYDMRLDAPIEASRAMGGHGLRLLNMGRNPLMFNDKSVLEAVGIPVPKEVPVGEYTELTDKSFRHIINQIPAHEVEPFELYGWARTTLARWESRQLEYPGRTEGFDAHTLRQMIAETEKAHPEWVGVYEDVNAFMDQVLLAARLMGEIPVEDIARMKAAHPEYWPLPRIVRRVTDQRGGTPPSSPSAGIRQAFGSPEQYQNLKQAVNARVNAVIKAHHDNNLMLSIRDLAQELTNRTDLPADVRAIGQQIMTPINMDIQKVATLDPDEMKQIIAEYLTKVNGEPVKAGDIELELPGRPIYRATSPRAYHVVAPIEDGQRRFYQIEDKWVYSLFANAEDPSLFLDTFFKITTPITNNWKRHIANTVGFIWGNLGRDPMGGVALSPFDENRTLIPGYFATRGLLNRITKKYPDAFEEGHLMSMAVDATSREEHRGAVEAFMDMFTEDIVPENPGAMSFGDWVMSSFGILNGTVLKPLDILEFMSGLRWFAKSTESLSREGAFAHAKDIGWSTSGARGAYGKVTGKFGNKPGSAVAHDLYRNAGFLNPAMQVLYQNLQQLFGPYPGTAKRYLFAKLPVIAMFGAVGAIINFLLTGDDKKEQMKERPDDDRMRYMALFGVLRAPFAYGIEGAIQSFSWNLVEQMLLQDAIAPERQARQMLMRMMDFPGNPIAFMHPWLKTLLETKTNYSFFYDEKIVPSMMEVAHPNDPGKQAYDSTPEFYKAVGEATDVSPIKIQYAVRNMFTSQMDDTLKAFSLAFTNQSIEEPADIPYIGRLFIRSASGWRAQSVKDIGDAEDKFQSVKRLYEEMLKSDSTDFKQMDELQQQLWNMQRLHQAYLDIKRMSTEIRKLRREKTPNLDRIKELEGRMVVRAQQALQ